MSHQIKVKSKLTSLALLKKALTSMGITGLTTGKRIGNRETVISADSIGFVKESDGTLTIVGDPYYSSQQAIRRYYGKEKELLKDVSTAYLLESAKADLKKAGFKIVPRTKKVKSNGLVTVEAIRY